MKRKVLLMITCVCLMAFMLSGCGCSSESESGDDGVLEILDYATVTFEGENGSGTANVSIDYDGLELEMVGGQEALDELDDVEDLDVLGNYMSLAASLSFDTDKSDGLSNGDTVTLTVTYDEELAENAGVTIGDELSRTYTVEGLE
ncbi:MAG: hypothetical protein K5840_03580 [Eubacterium sp.]|nr:hypothetical protein [Eubacterium sp.]